MTNLRYLYNVWINYILYHINKLFVHIPVFVGDVHNNNLLVLNN